MKKPFKILAFPHLIMVYAFLSGLLFVYMSWSFNTDDAYITLRYSKHLLEGLGLIWNQNELPTEGFTNFLFVILGAVAISFNFNPILMFKIVSCIALFGSLFFLYRLSRLWLPAILAIVPVLIVASTAEVILWTVSGLETAVYLFFVLGTFYYFLCSIGFKEDNERNYQIFIKPLLISALLALAAAFTRFEGAVLFPVLLFVLLIDSWQHRSLRKNAPLFIIFCLSFTIPYLIYFIWRWHYFAAFIPNAVSCKLLSQNNHYPPPLAIIKDFFKSSAIFIIFSLYSYIRNFDARLLLFGLFTAIYLVLSYRLDPVLSYAMRYLIPAFCLLVITTTITWMSLGKLIFHQGSSSATPLLLTAILLCIANICNQIKSYQILPVFSHHYAKRMAIRSEIADYLNKRMSQNDFAFIGDVGLIGYKVKANIIDAYCLNNKDFINQPSKGNMSIYLSSVLFQNPPKFIVLISETINQLTLRKYMNIDCINQNPYFKNHYHLNQVFATIDKYHYFVFEHISQQKNFNQIKTALVKVSNSH